MSTFISKVRAALLCQIDVVEATFEESLNVGMGVTESGYWDLIFQGLQSEIKMLLGTMASAQHKWSFFSHYMTVRGS